MTARELQQRLDEWELGLERSGLSDSLSELLEEEHLLLISDVVTERIESLEKQSVDVGDENPKLWILRDIANRLGNKLGLLGTCGDL